MNFPSKVFQAPLMLVSMIVLAAGHALADTSCLDYETCLREAQDVLVSESRFLPRDSAGKSCKDSKGCLVTTRTRDGSTHVEGVTAHGGTVMNSAIHAPRYWVNEKASGEPISPFLLSTEDMTPVDTDHPYEGFTVLAVYYGWPEREPDKTYSLFSMGIPGTYKSMRWHTMASLGIRGDALLYGAPSLGLDANTDFWMPLWEPAPASGYAWGAVAATFQKDGKLRIDQITRFEASTPRFTSESSLLEAGWPILNYPDGTEEKTYLDATTPVIGSSDTQGLYAPVLPGLETVAIFEKPLTGNEIKAYAQASLFVNSIPPEKPYTFVPCNSGGYLNKRKASESGILTTCGMKESPMGRLFTEGDHPVMLGLSGSRLKWISRGQAEPLGLAACHGGYPPDEGLWQAIPAAGINNYVFWNEHTNTVLADTQEGVKTATRRADSVTDPEQIWHVHIHEDADTKIKDMRIMSLGSGRLILGIEDSVPSTGHVELELPEDATSGQGWYKARDCSD